MWDILQTHGHKKSETMPTRNGYTYDNGAGDGDGNGDGDGDGDARS